MCYTTTTSKSNSNSKGVVLQVGVLYSSVYGRPKRHQLPLAH